MFHKSRVYKQLEIVVTIVFYAVMLALLVVIATSFSKEIYTRYAAYIETGIMTAGDLPVITSAYDNPPSHLTSIDRNITDSDISPEYTATVKQLVDTRFS